MQYRWNLCEAIWRLKDVLYVGSRSSERRDQGNVVEEGLFIASGLSGLDDPHNKQNNLMIISNNLSMY